MFQRIYTLEDLAEFFSRQADKFFQSCELCGLTRDTCHLHQYQADRLREAAMACRQSKLGLNDPRVFAARGLFHIVFGPPTEEETEEILTYRPELVEV